MGVKGLSPLRVQGGQIRRKAELDGAAAPKG